MANEDVVDGELAKCVVDRQDGAAGIAKDSRDALANESSPEDFGSGELRVLVRIFCHRVLLR
jgi:hypothetical protein